MGGQGREVVTVGAAGGRGGKSPTTDNRGGRHFGYEEP